MWNRKKKKKKAPQNKLNPNSRHLAGVGMNAKHRVRKGKINRNLTCKFNVMWYKHMCCIAAVQCAQTTLNNNQYMFVSHRLNEKVFFCKAAIN